MPKHEDYCTLLKNEEDKDILTRKLFDVNIRLYNNSEGYRRIVEQCCSYLSWCAMTTKEGYKKPHGYSGANAGIPFNLVALSNGLVMINPKILEESGYKTGLSNCGSLVLEKPIKIWRYSYIKVGFYNRRYFGRLDYETLTGYLPTVQHEVDHNNGILITDRKV